MLLTVFVVRSGVLACGGGEVCRLPCRLASDGEAEGLRLLGGFEAFGVGEAEVAASVVTGADRPSAASAWSAPESGRISTAPVAPTTITEATASSVTFRRG